MFGYLIKGGLAPEELGAMSQEDHESLPLLTATNRQHYVDLASRLIQDGNFRKKHASRQLQLYEDQQSASFENSRRFRLLIGRA